jgi:hypothetical protein
MKSRERADQLLENAKKKTGGIVAGRATAMPMKNRYSFGG